KIFQRAALPRRQLRLTYFRLPVIRGFLFAHTGRLRSLLTLNRGFVSRRTSVAPQAIMSLLPFSSQLIADVGISFGDEGKGRLIPEVAEELRGTPHAASVVLKVNGGANSGHTAGGI